MTDLDKSKWRYDINRDLALVEFSTKDFALFRDYLFFHESDIAYEINDFDDLRGLFIAIHGRGPKK